MRDLFTYKAGCKSKFVYLCSQYLSINEKNQKLGISILAKLVQYWPKLPILTKKSYIEKTLTDIYTMLELTTGFEVDQSEQG